MSRITKWHLEKAKVKVVFRLQFHATHIPQTGWDKLFISFIPTDSGKATAKTTKANVRNGMCKWADPIYETTRLLQDAKNKQYDEKLYKLVVAMGSPRSSLLGEAIINLADYVDALKPSSVALPLHGCSSGTILHVTVQLLTSKTGFREFEQQRELREKGLRAGASLNRHDESGTGKASSSEELANDQVNTRVIPESKELPSLEEEMGLNEEHTDSAIGFDGSSNTSESLYAEKNDTSSTHEIDSLKSTISGDLNGQSPQAEKGDPSVHRNLAKGSIDSVHGWDSGYSMDNDLATAYEENNRLKGSLEAAESSIFELKLEIGSLQSHADELGIETQKFGHQLAAEITSGEELAKEVYMLKSECLRFRDDLERLANLKLGPQFTPRDSAQTKQDHLIHDVKLSWLKGLLGVEDKIKELQNKMHLGFHGRDFGFVRSDFEALFSILHDLKQTAAEATSLPKMVSSERSNVKEIREMGLQSSVQFVSGTGMDLNLYQQENILNYLSTPGTVPLESDSIVAATAMNNKVFELLRELDEAKAERESLARKMDQMECYYEALIQELEENQKQMLGELQNLRNEHSDCIYTISKSKAEVESMHRDMNEQMLRYAEERCNLDSLNKELQRRAVTSEEALRRARLNYSIAVDQLQKDLELLSCQVLSVFETNESLIKQAFQESSQPCFQVYTDAEDSGAVKILQCPNKYVGIKRQLSGGDMLLGDMKKSLCLQEELYQKVIEDLHEMHSANLQLDVFSRILQETLLEANAKIGLMKEKMNELAQQLELSTESRNLLMVRLQTAMHDIHTLNEYKDSCIAKCNDMVLQNQILEAKLESILNENYHLREKIMEGETLVMECRGYESRYEACYAERKNLENLLEQKSLEHGCLQNKVSSLKEEFKTLKDEFDELVFSKGNLQKNVNFLQDKLGSLLASYDNQFHGLSLLTSHVCQELDVTNFEGIIMQLEEIQHNACKKILQTVKEKNDLEDEKKFVEVSLSTARSEILIMKQKFKHDMQDMLAKLDVSNALVEKLQLEIESVANKIHISSEVEEKCAQQNKELIADLALLEAELQNVILKKKDFSEEIVGLDSIAEELGRTKLTVTKLLVEKQELMKFLQSKAEENMKLATEIDSFKESLRCLQDEVLVERGVRDMLEGKVMDLNSQLNKRHDQLLHFDKQKSELVHFRKLASDLDLEKSRVCHLLLHHEESLEKLRQESSCLQGLGSELSEMHECWIAADVKLTFVKTHYETLVEQLVQQLKSSDGYISDLKMKHLDAEAMLKGYLTSEAHYVEENAYLVKTLESLRSELEASVAENRVFSDSNNVIKVQLAECKQRLETLEFSFSTEVNRHSLEIEDLKHTLVSAEEEIDYLVFSKEELEITFIVLKAKLDEQDASITLLEECNGKLMILQNQCDKLTQKLYEQVLRTEEFKNLSIHLKELKDKAEAECLQVREKRKPEGPSHAMQESLRIAFIKEQYETRLQELKQQLSISKKHGEEMLLKLQDAIDANENLKKSEASHLKRNEELSLKILELEAELHSVLSERRDKIKAYDRIKAELECALLTLECCKEEKEKLGASLHECNEERSKISAELTLMKGQLGDSASLTNMQKEENDCPDKVSHISGELIMKKACQGNPLMGIPGHESIKIKISENGSSGIPSPNYLNRDLLIDSGDVEYTKSSSIGESEYVTAGMEALPIQDAPVSKGVSGTPEHGLLNQGDFLCNNSKHLAVVDHHCNTQSLKSSIEHLHEELEKMKNENSILEHDHHFDPEFLGFPRELMQLHRANEELRSIFPPFNEYSESGSALERVLALEIELAEALRVKKKSSVHFQSSFLKQLGDEEAIFKSFRDINELIKDMLELKGRLAAVELELREMHDRYSQLSLHFAEVEGERQKLMMMLKNVRASKKLTYLNCSLSDSHGEHPS